jgi:hypothetical protein
MVFRGACLFGILAAVFFCGPSARASNPVIEGEALGMEVCTQLLCGEAVFVGTFAGMIAGKAGEGVFMIGAQHDGLPEAGQSVRLLGGSWNIEINGVIYQGTVLSGRLTNKGDETYRIEAVFDLSEGGTGRLQFHGLLDHNILPPVVKGRLASLHVF